MEIGHRHSGVSSKEAKTGLKPDPPSAEHLKPMLREGFTTPDIVQEKNLFFYHFTESGSKKT